MADVIIDEEFKALLPPLDEQAFKSLEASIVKYGCMNPLVLWNNILIDGYNRYAIVTKHGLAFNTTSLDFNSRDEVLIWIIETQIQRRNLTPMQLTYFRGLHYNTDKKLRGGADRFTQNAPNCQNDTLEGNTANRLSAQYNVSPRTIIRDAEVAEVIAAIGRESPDAKRDILSGAVRINRRQLRELSSSSENDISKTILRIESGTFEQNRQDTPLKDGSKSDDGSNLGDAYSFAVIFAKLSDDFFSGLHDISERHDPQEVKIALRVYIEELEEFYRRI